ncbi:MAG: hypothetical protein KGI92_02420 [Alphaproteobacteria bacterium]|nr:hypothetical protein [Alphaproteobacteria bacterium]
MNAEQPARGSRYSSMDQSPWRAQQPGKPKPPGNPPTPPERDPDKPPPIDEPPETIPPPPVDVPPAPMESEAGD